MNHNTNYIIITNRGFEINPRDIETFEYNCSHEQFKNKDEYSIQPGHYDGTNNNDNKQTCELKMYILTFKINNVNNSKIINILHGYMSFYVNIDITRIIIFYLSELINENQLSHDVIDFTLSTILLDIVHHKMYDEHIKHIIMKIINDLCHILFRKFGHLTNKKINMSRKWFASVLTNMMSEKMFGYENKILNHTLKYLYYNTPHYEKYKNYVLWICDCRNITDFSFEKIPQLPQNLTTYHYDKINDNEYESEDVDEGDLF
jgi:hypothetical protein